MMRGKLQLTVAVFTAALSFVLLATAQIEHLPFLDLGRNVTFVPNGDDVAAGINIPRGFPFGLVTHNSVHVSSNGLMSFGRPITSFSPQLFSPTLGSDFVLAPFWADMINVVNSSITLTSTRRPESLERVSSFISRVRDEPFSGTLMILAQWSNIPLLTGSPRSNTNTFQAIAITDGSESYAVFTYRCGDLQAPDNAAIGFKADSVFFRNHRLSTRPNVGSIACQNSPTVWSNVVYRITRERMCTSDEFECPIAPSSGSGSASASGSGFTDLPPLQPTLECIPLSSRCDGVADCFQGIDEQNCPLVTVGFVDLEQSVLEGDGGFIGFCIEVLSGQLTQSVVIEIRGDESETDTASIEDFNGNNIQPVFLQLSAGSTFNCTGRDDVVRDDNIPEDTEILRLSIFNINAPPNLNVQTDDNRSLSTVFIVDNDIVELGFDRSSYSVAEGRRTEVCVVVRGSRRLGRPIAVRLSSGEETATAGDDYRIDRSLPRILHFPITTRMAARDGEPMNMSLPIRQCIRVLAVDDLEMEGPESFFVSLYNTDVNVIVAQETATITIVDDEAPPTIPPATGPLAVHLAGNTPRIEGSNVVIMVQANKPAFAQCRLGRGTSYIDCPPGLITTFENVDPGSYDLRVVASSGSERASFSLTLVIPDDPSTCTIHLINTGVVVRGTTARVEFTGEPEGSQNGYLCSLDGEPPLPCFSPHVVRDQSAGDHRLRVTPTGCRDFRPQTFRFTITIA